MVPFTIGTGNSYTLDIVRPFWERYPLDENMILPGLVAVLSEQRSGAA